MAKGSAEAIAALTGFVKNLYDMIQGGDNEAIEVSVQRPASRSIACHRRRNFFGAVFGV